MRAALGTLVAGVFLLPFADVASGHRLDEYLQATTFSIGKERIEAQLRLTPGVAVLPAVLAVIDTDGDGVITEAEGRAYARRVLAELSLSIDSEPRSLELTAVDFPSIEWMRKGMGEIRIDFATGVPGGGRSTHQLSFENRHQRAISAYLVNCLVPDDPALRVVSQHRNYEQSEYRIAYSGRRETAFDATQVWLAAAAVAALAGRFAFAQRRRRAAPA
jgi:hypothetical protein